MHVTHAYFHFMAHKQLSVFYYYYIIVVIIIYYYYY